MKWYVKDLSKLTKVSVRTLHHYDEIELLKPSIRQSNGYRLYSEEDLLKLQRIVALKSFGFSLKQIKELVKNGEDVGQHFQAQQQCLQQQIQSLRHAAEMIAAILADGKKIEWSKVAQLIEVYHMQKEQNMAWAEQVFSPDQLRQLADLRLKQGDAQQQALEARWVQLMAEVKANVYQNPRSEVAQKLVKAWFDLMNDSYGDYPELRDAIQLAYKHNKIPDAPFDQKVWDFIEQATKYMESKKSH